MSNTYKVLSFVTNDLLRQVKNNLQFVKNIAGEDFGSNFTNSPKKGETINIRKPARFVGRTGETWTQEDYTERTVTMTVQPTAGVDLAITNRELMFQIPEESISERIVAPAASSLANIIDRQALLLAYQSVANTVGTPGTIPTALKTYNQARAKMSWEGTPQDGSHSMLITPDMQVEIVDTLKGLFQSSDQISNQYESGMMGKAVGAKWYECQNLIAHTVGQQGGTPLVNGASQAGSSLVTDGWTAAAANRLKAGDVFTIANVFAVNPFTRQSTGALRQFVVTADAASDGAGNATLSISPAIVVSGAFQNVSAAPADNAAITVFAAASTVTPVGLRFHKEAFLFSSFEQPMPEKAVEFAKQVTDPQTGIKLRMIYDWDTKANQRILRADVVWAFGTAFGEFATRVQS